MDLPVPVIRGVDPLAQGRRVQDQVVGRRVEQAQQAKGLLEHLRGRRQVGVGRGREVGRVHARNDPDLEGRTGCERGEGHARGVLEEEPLPAPHLLANHRAVGTLTFTNEVARGTADLLTDAVGDLGQVVQIEAEVVRQGACLRPPVLDDLEVCGHAGPFRGADLVARPGEHLDDDGGLLLGERCMMQARGDDRLPRTPLTDRGKVRLAGLAHVARELARLLLGA